MPHVENYTVGVRPMDWSAAMDRIRGNGENAVVHDLNQPGPTTGVMGSYYDAYADGSLIAAFDSRAEAEEAIRRASS